MGDSLGVSVSFGKYENDALSWEKWSTFSPNKYMEEVGKCSTPGSVALKKAFFEAHYKKIAAMKAQLDQEEAIHGSGNLQPAMQVGDMPETANSNAHKLQEAVLVGDECHFQEGPIPITGDINLEEANDESVKQLAFETEDPREGKAQNVPAKIVPNKVEKNSIGMKKKPASKSLETPATSLPKPKSTSSVKKASALPSSSSKNTNHSVSESRRATPLSLHLSTSMSSVNSDTVTSSRRRSLFMEQMGDKDIVKRAFKTFQNRVNQLPSSDKQLPTKRSEQKSSTSSAYQKENERSRKAAEKISPARGQSLSFGSLRGVGIDDRRLKAVPTSVALKSNERRKEFLKKLEAKSNARGTERSQLSLKSKEVKGSEMKGLNFKAKRLPSFYQAKGASDKVIFS